MPGIEVSADHNDLIFESGIGAGNFADDVKGFAVVVEIPVLDVEFDGDRHMLFKRAIDSVVMFRSKHNLVQNWRRVLRCVYGGTTTAASATASRVTRRWNGNNAGSLLHKNSAAIAAA